MTRDKLHLSDIFREEEIEKGKMHLMRKNGKKNPYRLTDGGEKISPREDEEEEGGAGIPAAKLQSPCSHLHYLTFHPLQTPSSYCCPRVLHVCATFW